MARSSEARSAVRNAGIRSRRVEVRPGSIIIQHLYRAYRAGQASLPALQSYVMMYHPKTLEWDGRLKDVFDRIDRALEDRYHGRWKLRRNRPMRGETANPEADGLFNIGVFFTPGYGSRLGRGYLVEIVIATDESIPDEEQIGRAHV